MKQSFLEFCKDCKGYQFYNKVTHQQVYKYEIYWQGHTFAKCLSKYDVVSFNLKQ